MPVRIRASPRRYSRKLFTPFLLSFPPLPLPSPPVARPAGGRSPSFSQNFREVDIHVSGFYLSDLFNSLTVLVFIIIIPRVILVRKRANFDGMLEKKGREREREIAWKKDHAAAERTRVKGSRDFSSSRLAIRIAFPAIPSVHPVKQAFPSFHRCSPPSSRQNEYVCYVQTAAREKAARGRATR